jgi:hypothetical protein
MVLLEVVCSRTGGFDALDYGAICWDDDDDDSTRAVRDGRNTSVSFGSGLVVY